jgi:hypothetical protein
MTDWDGPTFARMCLLRFVLLSLPGYLMAVAISRFLFKETWRDSVTGVPLVALAAAIPAVVISSAFAVKYGRRRD